MVEPKRFVRVLSILRRLQDGIVVSYKGVARDIIVGERSFQRDIYDLKEAGFDIVLADGQKGHYKIKGKL